MSILTDISDLTVRIATEFNLFKTNSGDLSNLPTTDKSSLVNSIIELETLITNIDYVDLIDDGQTSLTNRTWSMARITSYIDSVKVGMEATSNVRFVLIENDIELLNTQVTNLQTDLVDRDFVDDFETELNS